MGKVLRKILTFVLLGVFLFSSVKILMILKTYRDSKIVYDEAVESFVRPAALPKPAASAGAGAGTAAPASGGAESSAPAAQAQPPVEAEELRYGVYAPIAVDFEALCELNDDVFGWLYCEDTVINYPVAWGRDNAFYLTHNYRGAYDRSGTIFSDMKNEKGVSDSNIIIYGHHMYNMTMLGSLEFWREQKYYDEHPVMWLLTPEQDYRVELFSCYETEGTSDVYTVFHEPCDDLRSYIRNAAENSLFSAPFDYDPEAHYIVLSTCSYTFFLARTVLHGKLVPVDSAGGMPLPGFA